ncbi:hypothetical protein KOR34_43390 [Posidoniimonas corsicana]|uniref:TIGR04222 domain-containing membrane protein n=1 Tax=Posidoniimonas corsicana TaxID=1938618 RepID=A0A5C5UX56_9BACT|nr:TIGR04222 domain-containing membrane protein [Posidoniimonas corsicana]TWT30966.1 hypothetical protein KOR34_43390 [Posidoniimonas corsicana]
MDVMQQELWRRLERFQFDDPASAFTFTQRLARENHWTVGHANAVVDEYRRFLFLAMTAGHEVTPSEAVDQAWHLHLTYTRSYWDELCGEVLGCPLHHGPTKGGAADAARFREQYDQTLAGYRRAFGVAPPTDTWPSADVRFARRGGIVSVDKRRAWVVPKPWAALRPIQLPRGARLAFGVAPVMLLAMTNPFDLNGPEFLTLYGAALAMTVVVAALLRWLLRPGEHANSEPLDPYQAACLSDGVDGAVRAATASLLRDGSIRLAPATGGATKDMRFSVGKGTQPDADELEQRIVAACGENNGARYGELLERGKPAAEKVQHRLEAWGLLVPSQGVHSCRWAPALLMAGLFLFGCVKVYVGLQRDKPIGFLVALLFLTFFITIWFVSKPHRTVAGTQMLRALKRERRELRKKKNLKHSPDEALATAWAVALFGVAPCAYGDLLLLPTACKFPDGPTASGSGSGGCGGGDSGGGGCGGGGCGGGCGGCGG